MTEDHWLRMRDTGFVDEEGFLNLTGRCSDLVSLGDSGSEESVCVTPLEQRLDKTCAAVSPLPGDQPTPSTAPHCPDPDTHRRHRSRNSGAGASQLADILRGGRISDWTPYISIFHVIILQPGLQQSIFKLELASAFPL